MKEVYDNSKLQRFECWKNSCTEVKSMFRRIWNEYEYDVPYSKDIMNLFRENTSTAYFLSWNSPEELNIQCTANGVFMSFEIPPTMTHKEMVSILEGMADGIRCEIYYQISHNKKLKSRIKIELVEFYK